MSDEKRTELVSEILRRCKEKNNDDIDVLMFLIAMSTDEALVGFHEKYIKPTPTGVED